MKILIDERTYEGSGTEIMEQLRLQSFEQLPDAESYLRQLQSNFMRATDRECVLPDAPLERQARVLFAHLATVGALEVLDDG